MKKMNKLFALAIASLAILSISSCAKTFTTGELKGTWKVDSQMMDSKSEETRVDDSSIDDEILKIETVYSEDLNTSSETVTTTYDGTGGSDARTKSVRQEDKTSSTILATLNTFYKNDSTHLDTLREVSGIDESMSSEVTINNDGTFVMTTIKTDKSIYEFDFFGAYKTVEKNDDISTTIINGTWAYIGKNKSDDVKNNERIGLWFKDGTINSTNKTTTNDVDTDSDDLFDYDTTPETDTDISEGTYTYTSTNPQEIWKLNSKSKDVMEVEFENEIENASNTTTSTSSSDPSFSFVSKSNTTSSSMGSKSFTKQ